MEGFTNSIKELDFLTILLFSMIKPFTYHSYEKKEKLEKELMGQIHYETKICRQGAHPIFNNAQARNQSTNSFNQTKRN